MTHMLRSEDKILIKFSRNLKQFQPKDSWCVFKWFLRCLYIVQNVLWLS